MVKVIFVSGVHGVGKTTICNEIRVKNIEIDMFDASGIIANEKNKNITTDKNIDLKSLDSNQELLLKGLSKIESEIIFLTGHTAFIGADNQQVINLDLQIFDKMNLVGYILLTRDSEAIVKGLNVRDHKKYDINIIDQIQVREIENYDLLTKRYNLHGLKLNIDDYTNFDCSEKILEYLKAISSRH